MKRTALCLLSLTLALTACGAPERAPSPAPSAPPVETAASTPAPEESSAPAAELTPEEAEEARQAALDYYAGTVFEVSALTELAPADAPGWEGEILFRAACSKGGEAQPDRTVALERQDGVWSVVSEGY